MAQCMNALADKYKNKKCHAHSDMHSWPHYSTTITMCTRVRIEQKKGGNPTTCTLCLLSLPRKKIAEVTEVAVMLKQSSNKAQRTISWLLVAFFFERNTYPVAALGCLKKKKANSDFRPFQVCHF